MRQRIQFDCDKNLLEKLAKAANTTTRTKTVKQALSLYEEILAAKKRGAEICLRESDGTLSKVIIV